MLKSLLTVIAIIALGALAACATTPGSYDSSGQSISIPYDPYNYDPDELFAEAQAHCNAYGLNAVYVDETIDPNSVRWRYRHFQCV